MRKRILCCIVILVILSASIIPAFGVGVGDIAIDDLPVQAGIQFDTLTYLNGDNYGTVVSWPFNEAYGAVAWINQEHYEEEYSVFVATVIKQSNSIFGYFNPRTASEIRMDARVMFFNKDATMYIRGEMEGVAFKRIKVSYDFVSIEQNSLGTDYVAKSTHVELSSPVSSVDQYVGLSVGSFISSAYWHATGNEFPSGDQLLANVKVEITYSDPNDEGFQVSVSTRNAPTNFFSGWVSSQNLKASGEDSNMFTWLLNVVDSFMKLELFPGFSLNTLFWFVIILLIVMVLLKIFT